MMDADAITTLANRIGAGSTATIAELHALLEVVDHSPAFTALLAGATALRNQFLGDHLMACSILNAKAGDCSEDCAYCAQARGRGDRDHMHHAWLDDGTIAAAARSAAAEGASAFGLVAAWKGLQPGTMTGMVCRSIAVLRQETLRVDASLGLLPDLATAQRLRDAGLSTYHHNLETARSFFPRICRSHTWEERRRTIDLVRAAGLRLCSGGIFGLGEDHHQRVEFLDELRALHPDSVPINFFNPVPGCALADRQPLPAGEALVILATCRYALPDRNLLLCGGKEVTLGARLAEALDAGVSGVMVGNYLTTLGTPAGFWQEAAATRGLRFDRNRGC
jgi:biotin synthase